MYYKRNSDNIYLPQIPITHRDEEYEQDFFTILREMQERHFWYRGRHRSLLEALDRQLPTFPNHRNAIDFFGGGRWLGALSFQ